MSQQQKKIRSQVLIPPTGWQRLRWYGPGLLWMLSSVGSGSVLFTPRVGSQYGYSLLWAALLVILAQWVMIREVGRYTVVTGRTFLDGLSSVPGPRGWAIWIIFLPQVLAAVVTIAGIAALAGSAMMIALPGSQALYATGLIILSIVLVVTGSYKGVEHVSAVLAALLVLSAVLAAAVVFPDPSLLINGLIPSIPAQFDLYFVLPWLGFILAGAAGVMWYSYWVAERGYGGEVSAENEQSDDKDKEDEQQRFVQLHTWLHIMSVTGMIGVATGALVVVSFLTLGAEILRPEGIVPEGIQVAEELTRLLSDVWGDFGYWLLLVGIVIALWGTILADQDGWGRTFADATSILFRSRSRNDDKNKAGRFNKLLDQLLENRERLKNIYAIVFTALVPLLIFWLVREPVAILSIGGIVAAAHTPVIVLLTLYINRKHLPEEMQPGWLVTAAMVASGLFFLVFAVLYFLNLAGVQLLS